MRKSTMIWLIVAASLTLLGALIFTCAMSMAGWDFTKLSTAEYETNIHEITGDFADISIDTITADVTILPSTDGKCRVECYEQKGLIHTVKIDGETLKITVSDTRNWYDNIGINSASASIKIYLPEGVCRGINVTTTTGDIRMENLSIRGFKFMLTTGDVYLSNVVCTGGNFISGSTGDITLKNVSVGNLTASIGTGSTTLESVIAQGKLDINCTTGDVKFDKCDASEIFVETNTGNVTGTLLSDKIFTTKTTTGDVHVPSCKQGGKCAIKTTTGDIEISIKK